MAYAHATESARISITFAQWPPPGRSGDFFVDFEHADGSRSFLLADVCGNGPAAAGIAARVEDLLRSEVERHSSPGRLLTSFNRVLARVLPLDCFVAALAVNVDPAAGTLRAAGAGHLGPCLRRGGASSTCALPGGPPLGLFEGHRYEEASFRVQPADLLLMASDGVSDRFAAGGDFTGARGLRDWLGDAVIDQSNVCRHLLSRAAPASDATVLALWLA
jgi:serine phosphatase RsbU (regulator of sigma subunit)